MPLIPLLSPACSLTVPDLSLIVPLLCSNLALGPLILRGRASAPTMVIMAQGARLSLRPIAPCIACPCPALLASRSSSIKPGHFYPRTFARARLLPGLHCPQMAARPDPHPLQVLARFPCSHHPSPTPRPCPLPRSLLSTESYPSCLCHSPRRTRVPRGPGCVSCPPVDPRNQRSAWHIVAAPETFAE